MSDRRRFLVGAGASILVAALPNTAEPVILRLNEDGMYAVGLVSNPDLLGPSGQLLLNVYLSVEDGTGVGTISDVVHTQVNCHVQITETRRHGNEFQFAGLVIRSNDPALVGQPVLVVATVHEAFTRLVLNLGEETFSGLGVATRAVDRPELQRQG